jgi:hypothetical protein
MSDRLEVDTQRAEEALRLLESPLFAAAFNDTRTALLEALAGLDNLRDDRARDLHSMVKGLDKVKRCLELHVQSGKLAQHEIQKRSRLQQVGDFARQMRA